MPRPSRPWFRFYVEAVHDRKLRRLKPENRWLFVACLAAARQSCEPGVLLVGENDPMTPDDLADFAGMTPRDVVQGLAALVTAGVLDVHVEGPRVDTYFVPAWGDRQYESDDVAKRTAKHRKERSNVVPTNVPTSLQGTPPDTEADTDTETPPLIEQIVDGVFAKVLAEKQRAGEGIRSVDGFRKWWDANEGDGCRKRAELIARDYEMLNLGQYVDTVRSPVIPPWAASMRRRAS